MPRDDEKTVELRRLPMASRDCGGDHALLCAARLAAIIAFVAVVVTAQAAPLRFAAMEMPKPDPCLPFITETHDWLNRNMPEGATFRYYNIRDLEAAVRNREVDIVLSEAGVVGRLRLDGARPLFSAVSARHKDPKRSQGSVFFSRTDREDLRKIADLKGKKLVATTPNDFTGFQAAMGELVRRSYDPGSFFSDVHFIGTSSKQSMQAVVDAVLDGRADVGVVRTCFLEDLEHMLGYGLPLKVVEPREDRTFACLRSTELYPNWTISSVPTLPAEELRTVMEKLLLMPPTQDGMYWSVASDFSSVDKLMKDLRIGPYEGLSKWSWARFWREFGTYVIAALSVGVLLLFHLYRTRHLLAKRTEELESAFAERTRLEAEAQAKEVRFEKLRRSTTVGQMSNMFVHELKQPLHTIACFSHGLRRLLDTHKNNPELLREGLEKIELEVGRAGDIIEHVRNYAKGREPERLPCDMMRIIKNTVSQIRGRMKSEIRLMSSISDAHPVIVRGDELELQFIAHSLIKNAAEAAEESPTGYAVVRIECGLEMDCFVCRIVDNGPQLSETDFERLRTPLLSSKQDGLGLGLTVTRSLLEKYRGHLSFERMADGGILTTLQLPLDKAETSDAPDA